MAVAAVHFLLGEIMKKNFFASLFDFKFETFITRRVAAVLYMIFTWLVLAFTATGMFGGFVFLSNPNFPNAILLGLASVFLSPIAGLLLLILVRVAFESSIALVSIAENTRKD